MLAALAAGVEYGSALGGVREQPRTRTPRTTHRQAARQFAGDPDQATRYNTEVTDDGNYSPTSRINVEINSNAQGGHVDPDTSWNDPRKRSRALRHTRRRRFSPADAYYVDVGVRESDHGRSWACSGSISSGMKRTHASS